MKEIINYYYHMNIDNLEELDGKYHFKYNKEDYFFVFYNRLLEELDDLIFCSKEMKERNIDCHDIILNCENQVLTKVGDYNYILLKVRDIFKEYSMLDMAEVNQKLLLNENSSKLYRNNWAKLWMDKNDYYEYQIRELALHKEKIQETFSYYLGLAENAISYAINTTKKYNLTLADRVVVSHRRIFYPNYKLNYLNPLAFVFDLEVRDMAEYLKALFFSNDSKETIEELSTYLKTTHFSIYSYQMLYARLLYPTYYFDVYDEIMNNDASEEKLVKIVDKSSDYEYFLKEAYLEISKYAPIEKISWLID